MKKYLHAILIFSVLTCATVTAVSAGPDSTATPAESFANTAAKGEGPSATGESVVVVAVNKSRILEHSSGIRRISVTNGDIAEAVAVSPNELVINGKAAGETSLILWNARNERAEFDIHVEVRNPKLEAMYEELAREVGPGVTATMDGDTVFLRGTVKDAVTAARAATIASVGGRVVNLLRVTVPDADPQILLKVRFATVSRTATQQLGFNFYTADQKGVGNVTTGQFGQYPTGTLAANAGPTFSDLMNIFYFRPDLNMTALITALEAKGLLQMLAEPNLLTVPGRPASFLAGGEYPFPTLQGGGGGVGQITIQFKEFGIRLGFLPTITPRGSIRLQVTPEVSSLDYTNGLTAGGFTVPGLATRRVQTEVELNDGQSFVIAGLLDKQVTDQLNKIPGLSSLPVLGKLFESRSLVKNDTELLVLVTPELVGPMSAGMKAPDIAMPLPFLKDTPLAAPRTPGTNQGVSVPPVKKSDSIPVEQLPEFAAPSVAPSTAGPASPTAPPQAPQMGAPGIQSPVAPASMNTPAQPIGSNR